MRTARLLPVSAWSGGVPGPGVYLVPGGVPGPGGGGWDCTWSRGVYLVTGGYTWSGGVPGPGGGVPAQVLPPVNRMTDRCKNITLPQTSFAGGNKRQTSKEIFAFGRCECENLF